MDKFKYIFTIVNDSKTCHQTLSGLFVFLIILINFFFWKILGSHWGLLVYFTKENLFYYFDSANCLIDNCFVVGKKLKSLFWKDEGYLN